MGYRMACIMASFVIYMATVSWICGESLIQYENCDGIPILPANYTKVDLVMVGKAIHDIAVSHHTGNVYVAYLKWPLLVLQKGDYNLKAIVGIYDNILSVAVDLNLPKVYIGCQTQVKIYNEVTGRITIVLQIPYSVSKLFVPRNNFKFYGMKNNNLVVYQYANDFKKVSKLNIQVHGSYLNRFVIDRKGNYYYTTEEYGRNITKIKLKEFNSTTYNGGTFFNLAVDSGGRVFGTANGSLYHLKANDSMPQFVTKLDLEPRRMCFDKYNNIIFGTEDEKIVMYKHNYECSLLSASKLINSLIPSNLKSTIFPNRSSNLDYIMPEVIKTDDLNINTYDKILKDIESVKENQNNFTKIYNDLMVKIRNTAKELNIFFIENERRTKEKIDAIETKIQVGNKITRQNRIQNDNY